VNGPGIEWAVFRNKYGAFYPADELKAIYRLNKRKVKIAMRVRQKDGPGLTAIELIIIIVVLGIITGMALPEYKRLTAAEKESETRKTLGLMRSAISVWYINRASITGTPSWPSLDTLVTIPLVLPQGVPPNPYQRLDMAPDSIIDGRQMGKGQISGGRGGWVYNPNTGHIWPNTDFVGENGW
jgi:hypothetical protein